MQEKRKLLVRKSCTQMLKQFLKEKLGNAVKKIAKLPNTKGYALMQMLKLVRATMIAQARSPES